MGYFKDVKFVVRLLLAVVSLVAASGTSVAEVLIDDFSSNGTNGDYVSIDISADSPGPTNAVFSGLGPTAIGDRTSALSAIGGVPAGNYAYTDNSVFDGGSALIYNSGAPAGDGSRHQISWALSGFDLLSAVGATAPEEIFFKLSFGSGNAMHTAEQVFSLRVNSAAGYGVYGAVVSSNELGTLDYKMLGFTGQVGLFDAGSVNGILLEADLPFAGATTSFEFTSISAVPEPSVSALLVTAAVGGVLFVIRRALRRRYPCS